VRINDPDRDASGNICGFNYQSTVFSAVTISVDSTGRMLVVRPVGPMSLRATVKIMGFDVAAPCRGVSPLGGKSGLGSGCRFPAVSLSPRTR
jgi:hypothetical protein